MSEITDEMRNAVLNARGADDSGTFMPLAEMLRHCGESKPRIVADAILSAVAPLIAAQEREAIEGRLDESVDSFEINVVGAPHADKVRVGDCEWFCRAPDVAKLIIDIRAILTRLKETPNAA